VGARIMHFMFDWPRERPHPFPFARPLANVAWRNFMLCHSRHIAKQMNLKPSSLCMADKLSFSLVPRWFYFLVSRATGEVVEYTTNFLLGRQYDPEAASRLAVLHDMQKVWHAEVKKYMAKWVAEHKDGSEDTWTRDRRLSREAAFKQDFGEGGEA
jgi:hypothetical protein